MDKQYRYDVVACLIAPVALTIAAAFLLSEARQAVGGAHGLALLVLLCIGALAEALTLRERGVVAASDRGLLSGLATGSVLSIPIADRFLFGYCQFTGNEFGFFLIGAALFLAGTALRWRAKAHLKEHFSHTIRVLPEHRVITSGPYRLVRHPAYLGTLLLVIGNSLLFNSWVGLLMALLLAPFGWHRITLEERLLQAELGDSYAAYASRVKRLIPWVL